LKDVSEPNSGRVEGQPFRVRERAVCDERPIQLGDLARPTEILRPKELAFPDFQRARDTSLLIESIAEIYQPITSVHVDRPRSFTPREMPNAPSLKVWLASRALSA